MIRLIAEDIATYTYMTVAMCGEVEKRMLLDNGIKEVRYMRESVKKCVDKKYIAERKTSHGKILRLTHKGYTALSNVPALKYHYEGLTDKHTFKNDPVVHARRSAAACAILAAMNAGLGVDNISLTYEGRRGRRENPKEAEGKIEFGKRQYAGIEHLYVFYENEGDEEYKMEYTEFVKRIPANHTNLFTGGRVKESRHLSETEIKAIIRSRTKGHIFGGHTGYAVYAMPTSIMPTNETDENAYGRYVSNVHRAACGRAPLPAGEFRAMNGNAIVICENESMVQEIIAQAGGRFTLHKSFAHTYVVPMRSPSLCLITKDGWRDSLIEGLYDEAELCHKNKEGFPSCCNAVVGGKPSLDMYAFDINKILKSFNVLKGTEGLHIICSKWQVPMMKGIYEKYKDKVVIEAV